MTDKFNKIIALVISIVFQWNTIAWAVPLKQPLPIGHQPLAIHIPEQYGRIEASQVPPQLQAVTGQASPKSQVVLIKDAHCNYEAQRNITKILDILIKDYGIDLVAVEGASGETDPSIIAGSPDEKRRKEVADRYLKKGWLTASEVVAMERGKNYGFSIWGVEDLKLYLNDLKAFRDVYSGSKVGERFIEVTGGIASILKDKLYTKEALDFDKKIREYRDNKLSLAELITYLYRIDIKRFISHRNLHLVLKAIRIEDATDFNRVEKERSALIKDIETKYPKEEIKELVKNSLLYKLGKLSSTEYYSYLKRYIQPRDCKRYINLYRYIKNIKLHSKINEDGLFNEIDTLINDIYRGYIKDELAWKLYNIDEQIYLLGKLARLEITRGELERLNGFGLRVPKIVDFLRIQCGAYGIKIPYELTDMDFISELDNFYKHPEEFYRYAFERDSVFINNLVSKMDETGKDKAVLILGGFHADGVERLLKERDIQVITIVPSITKEDTSAKKIYLSRIMDDKIQPDELLSELGLKNLQAPVITGWKERYAQVLGDITNDALRGQLEGALREADSAERFAAVIRDKIGEIRRKGVLDTADNLAIRVLERLLGVDDSNIPAYSGVNGTKCAEKGKLAKDCLVYYGDYGEGEWSTLDRVLTDHSDAISRDELQVIKDAREDVFEGKINKKIMRYNGRAVWSSNDYFLGAEYCISSKFYDYLSGLKLDADKKSKGLLILQYYLFVALLGRLEGDVSEKSRHALRILETLFKSDLPSNSQINLGRAFRNYIDEQASFETYINNLRMVPQHHPEIKAGTSKDFQVVNVYLWNHGVGFGNIGALYTLVKNILKQPLMKGKKINIVLPEKAFPDYAKQEIIVKVVRLMQQIPCVNVTYIRETDEAERADVSVYVGAHEDWGSTNNLGERIERYRTYVDDGSRIKVIVPIYEAGTNQFGESIDRFTGERFYMLPTGFYEDPDDINKSARGIHLDPDLIDRSIEIKEMPRKQVVQERVRLSEKLKLPKQEGIASGTWGIAYYQKEQSWEKYIDALEKAIALRPEKFDANVTIFQIAGSEIKQRPVSSEKEIRGVHLRVISINFLDMEMFKNLLLYTGRIGDTCGLVSFPNLVTGNASLSQAIAAKKIFVHDGYYYYREGWENPLLGYMIKIFDKMQGKGFDPESVIDLSGDKFRSSSLQGLFFDSRRISEDFERFTDCVIARYDFGRNLVEFIDGIGIDFSAKTDQREIEKEKLRFAREELSGMVVDSYSTEEIRNFLRDLRVGIINGVYTEEFLGSLYRDLKDLVSRSMVEFSLYDRTKEAEKNNPLHILLSFYLSQPDADQKTALVSFFNELIGYFNSKVADLDVTAIESEEPKVDPRGFDGLANDVYTEDIRKAFLDCDFAGVGVGKDLKPEQTGFTFDGTLDGRTDTVAVNQQKHLLSSDQLAILEKAIMRLNAGHRALLQGITIIFIPNQKAHYGVTRPHIYLDINLLQPGMEQELFLKLRHELVEREGALKEANRLASKQGIQDSWIDVYRDPAHPLNEQLTQGIVNTSHAAHDALEIIEGRQGLPPIKDKIKELINNDRHWQGFNASMEDFISRNGLNALDVYIALIEFINQDINDNSALIGFAEGALKYTNGLDELEEYLHKINRLIGLGGYYCNFTLFWSLLSPKEELRDGGHFAELFDALFYFYAELFRLLGEDRDFSYGNFYKSCITYIYFNVTEGGGHKKVSTEAPDRIRSITDFITSVLAESIRISRGLYKEKGYREDIDRYVAVSNVKYIIDTMLQSRSFINMDDLRDIVLFINERFGYVYNDSDGSDFCITRILVNSADREELKANFDNLKKILRVAEGRGSEVSFLLSYTIGSRIDSLKERGKISWTGYFSGFCFAIEILGFKRFIRILSDLSNDASDLICSDRFREFSISIKNRFIDKIYAELLSFLLKNSNILNTAMEPDFIPNIEGNALEYLGIDDLNTVSEKQINEHFFRFLITPAFKIKEMSQFLSEHLGVNLKLYTAEDKFSLLNSWIRFIGALDVDAKAKLIEQLSVLDLEAKIKYITILSIIDVKDSNFTKMLIGIAKEVLRKKWQGNLTILELLFNVYKGLIKLKLSMEDSLDLCRYIIIGGERGIVNNLNYFFEASQQGVRALKPELEEVIRQFVLKCKSGLTPDIKRKQILSVLQTMSSALLCITLFVQVSDSLTDSAMRGIYNRYLSDIKAILKEEITGDIVRKLQAIRKEFFKTLLSNFTGLSDSEIPEKIYSDEAVLSRLITIISVSYSLGRSGYDVVAQKMKVAIKLFLQNGADEEKTRGVILGFEGNRAEIERLTGISPEGKNLYDNRLWTKGIDIRRDIGVTSDRDRARIISEQINRVAQDLIPIAREAGYTQPGVNLDEYNFKDLDIVESFVEGMKDKLNPDQRALVNDILRNVKLITENAESKIGSTAEKVRIVIRKDLLDEACAGVGIPGCFSPTGCNNQQPLVHALEANAFFVRVYNGSGRMFANAVICLTDKGVIVYASYSSRTDIDMDSIWLEAWKELSKYTGDLPIVFIERRHSSGVELAKRFGRKGAFEAAKKNTVWGIKTYYDFTTRYEGNGDVYYNESNVILLTRESLGVTEGLPEEAVEGEPEPMRPEPDAAEAVETRIEPNLDKKAITRELFGLGLDVELGPVFSNLEKIILSENEDEIDKVLAGLKKRSKRDQPADPEDVEILKAKLREIRTDSRKLIQALMKLLMADGEISEDELKIILDKSELVARTLKMEQKEVQERIVMYLVIKELEKKDRPEFVNKLIKELGDLGAYADMAEGLVMELYNYNGYDDYFVLMLDGIRNMFGVEAGSEADKHLEMLDEYKSRLVQIKVKLKAPGVEFVNEGDKIYNAINGYLERRNKDVVSQVAEIVARYLANEEEILGLFKDGNIKRKVKEGITTLIKRKGLDKIEKQASPVSEEISSLSTDKITHAVKGCEIAEKLLNEKLGGDFLNWDISNMLVVDAVYIAGVAEGGFGIMKNAGENLRILYTDTKQIELAKANLKKRGIDVTDAQFIDIGTYKTLTKDIVVSMLSYETKGKLDNIPENHRVIKGTESGEDDLMLMSRMAVIMGREVLKDTRVDFEKLLKAYYADTKVEGDIKVILDGIMQGIESGAEVIIQLPPIAPYLKAYYNALKTARETTASAA